MKKRILSLCLSICIMGAAMPLSAGAEYSDVPAGWARDEVYAAQEAGLMDGVGGGLFGYGQPILRRDFVIILSRMLGWTVTAPAVPSFTDVPAGSYYYSYVETAAALGVVDGGGAFEPDRAITRGEMAAMLVRGLGYQRLSQQVVPYGHGFSDVPEELAGYITVAVDIGMTNGLTATTFGPDAPATREQAAAMMMRVYRRLRSNTDWLHGFYAFSSYDQRALISGMDAVSLGWARMSMSADGPWLNTGRAGDNEWNIPTAYESITEYLKDLKKPAHLDVYMDMTERIATSDGEAPALRVLLANAAYRDKAADLLVSEATRVYSAIGRSPYSGVTVDFEGLRAEDKTGFSAFVITLGQKLRALNLKLYVTVQPAVFEEAHYDGFDFRAIGDAADKVILMAHDYHPTNLTGLVGSTWQLRTPLTPFAKVYYALRAATHPQTGVRDTGKLALAISFSTIGWELDEQGRVLSPTKVNPTPATLAQRIAQGDAVTGWSEEYRNAWVTYSTGGRCYHVWYEDTRAVQDKIVLARLFGINGVSLWRIGTIPDAVPYDVWTMLRGR